ncbi:hypothetical protein DVH24_015049 [Malus domestica]|uniref:Uncharacterized protein n=1 Tax=Malus domestica TaxID=3750 RepID=A0A498K0M4_MALDO|nr:hypothetical protein DVH24_015049 [Malus domestica]
MTILLRERGSEIEHEEGKGVGGMVKVKAQGKGCEVEKEKGDREGVKEKKTDGSAAREDETRSPLEIEGTL